LRAGNVLFTAPVSEVNQDMKFPIDMAINESEVAKGIPIINFLGFASTEVHRDRGEDGSPPVENSLFPFCGRDTPLLERDDELDEWPLK
jgi:hypothetical protein